MASILTSFNGKQERDNVDKVIDTIHRKNIKKKMIFTANSLILNCVYNHQK
jgi:hypothetical protein